MIFFATILATTVVANHGCECQPVVVGEAADIVAAEVAADVYQNETGKKLWIIPDAGEYLLVICVR